VSDDSQRVLSTLDRLFRDQLKLEVFGPPPDFYALRNSSQHNFCARAYVLFHISGYRPEPISTYEFQAYVEIGNVLHTANQEWAGRQGFLYGRWQCKQCKTILGESLGMPSHCPYCDNVARWRYIEYALVEPRTMLNGHCDGILCLERWGIPGWALWEIKSIGRKYIEDPEFDPDNSPWYWWHRLQANNYFHMAKPGWQMDHGAIPKNDRVAGHHPGFPRLQWIIHTYVCRDTPKLRRNFIHAPDEPTFDASVLPILEGKEALRNGQLPAGRCKDSSDELGRECPYRRMCFSPVLGNILQCAPAV
jgi:hypothetical protein